MQKDYPSMPMLIALHKDTDYAECIADIWAGYLTAQGVEVRWVDLLSHNALDQVHGCDGVMWRWGHKPTDKLAAYRILHSIETYLGIPVFPDHRTCWHYEDKLSQYYLLKAAGVPTPETWVFWEKEKALEWAYETNYPKVFKLSSGAGGSNVVKVSNAKEACRLIDRMFGPGIYDGHIYRRPNPATLSRWQRFKWFTRRCKVAARYSVDGRPIGVPGRRWLLEKGYVYFQEFIPHEFETRVTVIGNRAWGILRIPPPGDFRASVREISLDRDPKKIDLNCVQIAFDISEHVRLQSARIDFLTTESKPLVSELSYAVGQTLKPYPGYWNRSLDWIPGETILHWTQAEDFLAEISAIHTSVRLP